MYQGRDRDDNGIPDWQEDENYLDEAPRNAPVPVGAGGCLVALMSLLAGAVAMGRGPVRRGRAPGRSRENRRGRR